MGKSIEQKKRISVDWKDSVTWRTPVALFLVYMITVAGISFMNAGNSYEQAYSFRLFCIGYGVLVLMLMDWRKYVTFWSLGYLPLCYIFMHYAYLNHWIPDTCEYKFVDIIRYGKLTVLIWGIVLIALLRDLFLHFESYRVVAKRKVLALLWGVFAALLTIFNPGYYYAVFFAVCFTALFLVLADPQSRDIFKKALVYGLYLSFLFVTYKSLRHRPYDTERYLAYFGNTNTGGTYFAVVISVIFSVISGTQRAKLKKGCKMALLAVHYVFLSVAIGFAVFNYTRTTIAGMLFAFAVLFVVSLLWEKKKKQVLLRYGIGLIVCALMIYPCFLAFRYIPAYANAPTFFSGEYNPEVRVIQNDPVDSPKYTSMESFLTLALGKWGIYVTFNTKEDEGEGEAVVIDTERDVTNGRVEIWQAYLSRCGIKGHYPGHIELDSGYFVYHAHNTYIHVMYQYGLLTGIAFGLMVLGSFIASLFTYRAKAVKHPEMGAYVLISGICLVSMVTEWMWHPAYVICCTFCACYGLLLYEDNSRKSTKKSGEKRVGKKQTKRK